MPHNLTKERVIKALLSGFKEVQESFNSDKEVLATSRPSEDFVYIDSEILLQITGMISAELKIDIPAKCQLFVGSDNEALSVEEVADKLLELNASNGSR